MLGTNFRLYIPYQTMNGICLVEGRMALTQLSFESNAIFPSFFLLSLVFFISILLVFSLKRRRKKSNLPPSPPRLPFIGNLHQIGKLPHHSFRALSQKYGPLMWLQLGQSPTLVVSSPDLASEIIKTHDIVFANRPQNKAVKIILYGCKDIGFGNYGEDWKRKKKICVLELLSLKSVKSFKFIREEEGRDLVNEIREACESSTDGGSLDLSEKLMAASNNIVCRCFYGKKYNTKGSDGKFGELARKAMAQISTFSVGDLFPSLGWLDSITGLVQDFKATFKELDAFLDQVIAEHKRGNGQYSEKEKKDFVDILLQLQGSGMLDFELTQDDIKAILVDMFLGGSDTSSTALEWAMTELVKNPRMMKKVQEEVRRVVGHKSKVDEDDVNQMSYLKCVVKEILRLHPPTPLLAPHVTTCSVNLRGYTIPPNTATFINAWAIQRDPKYWDNPEEFIPERFESLQIDLKAQNFEFIPFGSGRRGCPGRAFGLAAVEYVLANLLYWFDWQLPSTFGSADDIDMSEECGLTVTKKVPLHLEPIPYSFESKRDHP